MSQRAYISQLQERAASHKARVLLPDSHDPRTIAAARMLLDQKIAQPILIGDSKELASIAQSVGLKMNGIECIDRSSTSDATLVELYYVKRQHKGISRADAEQALNDPLILAGLLLDTAEADCCVAGSTSSTAAVLRAALLTIPLAQGVHTLSSFFLMVLENRAIVYADCAVVPEPTAEQLVDIAYSAALNYRLLMSEPARVAFLSFSTKGSAEHPSVLKVRKASELFQQRYPAIVAEGEIQADVALVPSVAQRKAADSAIQGDANVLVFPSLDAGNIAYKLSERLAGAVALGPIIQGLSKPYCDLSRGCSAEDIVNTACISILMQQH